MRIEKITLENSDIYNIKKKLDKQVLSIKSGANEIELKFEHYILFIRFDASYDDNDMLIVDRSSVEFYISFEFITDSDGQECYSDFAFNESEGLYDYLEYVVNR